MFAITFTTQFHISIARYRGSNIGSKESGELILMYSHKSHYILTNLTMYLFTVEYV